MSFSSGAPCVPLNVRVARSCAAIHQLSRCFLPPHIQLTAAQHGSLAGVPNSRCSAWRLREISAPVDEGEALTVMAVMPCLRPSIVVMASNFYSLIDKWGNWRWKREFHSPSSLGVTTGGVQSAADHLCDACHRRFWSAAEAARRDAWIHG